MAKRSFLVPGTTPQRAVAAGLDEVGVTIGRIRRGAQILEDVAESISDDPSLQGRILFLAGALLAQADDGDRLLRETHRLARGVPA